MAGAVPNDLPIALSRQSQVIINNQKEGNAISFLDGAYLAVELYFKEISAIYSDLIDDNKAVIFGTEVDITTLGGNLALTVALDLIQARKDSMEGLSKAGLKNENKLWTLR